MDTNTSATKSETATTMNTKKKITAHNLSAEDTVRLLRDINSNQMKG